MSRIDDSHHGSHRASSGDSSRAGLRDAPAASRHERLEGRFDDWLEARARAVARRTGRRTFLARLGAWLVGGAALPLLPIARASGDTQTGDGASPDSAVPGGTAEGAGEGGGGHGAGRASSRVPAPSEDIPGPAGDPQSCDYWRHCAIDGFACACCGGSATTCPPGTEVSPVTWVGTCRNPVDGKDYLISYNDCCGLGACGRCACNRNQGERPEYHWYRNNDINWCAGARSQRYNCSIAVVIGQATEPQPER